MKCEQFDARWQQLLDDRLPVSSDPYLMAHCLTCESCAAQVAATESMLFGLEYDIPEMDEEFAHQVVTSATVDQSVRPASQLPTAGPARARGGWSVTWGPVVIAAAALTMIVSFANAPRWNSVSPNHSVANAPAIAHEMAGEPHDAPAITAIGSVDATTNEQAMQEMQALLVELAGKFPRDEAAKMLSDHMQRLDNVARPVAYSVGTAITAIYRSVGNSRPDKSAQYDWPTRLTSYS